MKAAVIVLSALLVLPAYARAQCRSDAECKGDRICVGGVCQAPASPVPPAAAAPAPRTGEPQGAGWASTAGALGIASAAAVLSLAIGAEVTKEDQIPAIPLGGAATLILAAMGPVVAGGAASAQGPGVPGNPGLRIAGWVFYGISLADALVLIALGVSEVQPPDGLTTSVGLIGAGALSFFAADAFTSASQAEDAARQGAATVAPALGTAVGSDGSAVRTVGLRLSF